MSALLYCTEAHKLATGGTSFFGQDRYKAQSYQLRDANGETVPTVIDLAQVAPLCLVGATVPALYVLSRLPRMVQRSVVVVDPTGHWVRNS